MRRDLLGYFAVVAVSAALSGVAGCAHRGTAASLPADTGDSELGRIRIAVERALVATPPGGYARIPTGVRLLALGRDDRAIVMNFSAELAKGGRGKTLEDAVHQILAAASDARTPAPAPAGNYTLLIDGVTLDAYLR